MGSQLVISSSAVLFHARLAVRNCLRSVRIKSSFFLLVYRILGSKTKNTVYSSFLSLTVEKTISYYYLLSLLIPIISYYSFLGGLYQVFFSLVYLILGSKTKNTVYPM